MKTYKVNSLVTIITRRVSRTFERTETDVTEAEIEMMVDHFRKCFEENTPPKTPPPSSGPEQ